MRRLTGTGLIALTILLCFARPASAQWDFLKWLEELSGPGQFVMNGVDVAVYCRAQTRLSSEQGRLPLRLLRSRSCHVEQHQVVRRRAAVVGPRHESADLSHDGHQKEHVSAQWYAASITYRVSRVTDVAANIGFVRFSGAEGIAFNKFTFDPYISVRPLRGVDGWTIGTPGRTPLWRLDVPSRLHARGFWRHRRFATHGQCRDDHAPRHICDGAADVAKVVGLLPAATAAPVVRRRARRGRLVHRRHRLVHR